MKISVLALASMIPFCGMAATLPLPSGKAELKRQATTVMAQKKFMPRIVNQSIVSGNKTLEVNPNGQLTLNSDGGTLARFFCYFTGTDQQTGQKLWIDAGNRYYKSTLRRTDSGFLYEGILRLGELEWKQYRQELTLQPDGLIRIDCEWFPSPDPEKLTLRNHSFWITLPRAWMDGKTLDLCGRKITVTPDKTNGILGTKREIDHVLTVCKGNPAEEFKLIGTRKSEIGGIAVFAFQNTVRISINEVSGTRKTRFYLDLRTGTETQRKTENPAGIDFKKIENLELPDRSSKNLFRNPSFEQGFHEYHLYHYGYDPIPGKWHKEPFVIDGKDSFAGEKSLMIRILNDRDTDPRSLRKAANLSTSPVILEPGIYICSFYAKGDGADQILNVWFNRFRSGSSYGALRKAIRSYPLTKEWKRYSFTFQLDLPKPIMFHMNAVAKSKSGTVRIDALQLEKGSSATPFETKAVEGELRTSAPDHFISAKTAVDAKLRLHTAPGVKGNATVSVKNFFNEPLFQQKFPFTANQNGIAELALPLDGKLGKGIFMIRTDYELEDGRRCYDQHRLTVADFLENKHPLKRMFAKQYGGMDLDLPDFLRLADRLRKVGIGSETHLTQHEKQYFDAYRAFGIEPVDGVVYSPVYRDGRQKAGFAILKQKPYRDYPQLSDTENILIRDFYLEADGRITPEYLKKLKEAVKTYVSARPWIKVWGFGWEVFAGFPVSWWSKTNDPDEAAAKFALLLKAFAEGVREADPSAKIYQDQPCSMTPENSIPETDRLLAACRKLGVKFDIIGFHPYRFSPENPDLDADAQTAFRMMKKNGYSDTTPVYWGEMMHWGPYNIPQWNTKSSSWSGSPVTWNGQCTLSYDMGWTEKLSAAWRARAWLVALKYADRILTAQSGNTNNFALDYLYTPRASQMVSNTLGNILGDARFRADIRFAPYIRAYVFEDARKRPVAAIWCHKESVDEGRSDAPVAEADFGDSLETILDLMNQERSFEPGKLRFPVMSTPLFLRGKPGTLPAMIAALERATVISGEGISPLMLSANPVAPDRMKVTMKNFLSAPFRGTLNTRPVEVPGNGFAAVELPLPDRLTDSAITQENLPAVVTANSGQRYQYDLSFRAQLVRSVPENVTLDTLDWKQISPVVMTNYYKNNADPSFRASYRAAWNRQGFFLEVSVTDPKFVHKEFPVTETRWDNDSLQVYFDALADARFRTVRGYDENDYDYAVYPNAAGTDSIVWRFRSADQQLGLGIHAPKDNTVAGDIPSSFTRTENGYRYRVFFPAKYLLPAELKQGAAIGVGIMVNNVNDPARKLYHRRVSALSNLTDGQDCSRKPHLWPVFLLQK